jgi:hypothetical protein
MDGGWALLSTRGSSELSQAIRSFLLRPAQRPEGGNRVRFPAARYGNKPESRDAPRNQPLSLRRFRRGRNDSFTRMTSIQVKLSVEELELLTTLASDQLFRREFIDPKMPGYKANSAEISMGKGLVSKLRALLHPEAAKKTQSARMAGSSPSSRHDDGV